MVREESQAHKRGEDFLSLCVSISDICYKVNSFEVFHSLTRGLQFRHLQCAPSLAGGACKYPSYGSS
jgi:hypothetical protein